MKYVSKRLQFSPILEKSMNLVLEQTGKQSVHPKFTKQFLDL